ncbi:MAG: copper resistance protein CopZ [bacterium]
MRQLPVNGGACHNPTASAGSAGIELTGWRNLSANAVVTFDPQKVAPAELKVLIEDLGYAVAERI